ncbi:MAG: hypothetical protein J1E78_00220 [Muribaculaceae bacterium]|nr:hypothetical protein [Muribaculaceae bacterium]
MTQIELTLKIDAPGMNGENAEILKNALEARKEAGEFIKRDEYLEAMERTVAALRIMREYPEFTNPEFRILFVALLFDLAEIHYCLKNYKQSEKELDVLFKMLDILIKTDEERFGPYHIMAMELSTRILRSRKKALDLLVKQQITMETLYDKVKSGLTAATDRLVESLRTTGQLLASTGDIREALKFYAEAIKYSKKRTGKVTAKEIKLTIEMAEVMMRLRVMQPRAKRLLEAILPHAESLSESQSVKNIESLLEIIENSGEPEKKWRLFLHKITTAVKLKTNKK